MVSIAQGDGINRSHSIKSKHLVLVTVGLFLVPLQEEEPGIEIVSGRGVGAGEQGSAGEGLKGETAWDEIGISPSCNRAATNYEKNPVSKGWPCGSKC
jgi:hypothetical protein